MQLVCTGFMVRSFASFMEVIVLIILPISIFGKESLVFLGRIRLVASYANVLKLAVDA